MRQLPGNAEPVIGFAFAYDSEGNRLYLDNLAIPDRSEAYGHDNRHRLTQMKRGLLSTDAGGAVTVATEDVLSNANLAGMQQWVKLDTRGNWLDFREAKAGQTRKESRRRNGANEYLAIDPDGSAAIEGGPLTDRLLAHDRAGNLTFDPLAKVAGSTGSECGTGIPPCGPGQEYAYDAEQRVRAIYRDTDDAVGPYFTSGPKIGQINEPLVTEFVYDALGRRVETIDYVDAATGATLSTPKRTRHVYLGLESIQEYECGPEGYACDIGYVKSREFVWGDPDRFPETVAMVRYMQEYHAVPSGEPPIPPTPHVDGVFHYLHDVLGSVIGLVNDAGELVERYTYDPYGKVFIEKWDAAANSGAGAWAASEKDCGPSTCGKLPVSSVGNPFIWHRRRGHGAWPHKSCECPKQQIASTGSSHALSLVRRFRIPSKSWTELPRGRSL